MIVNQWKVKSVFWKTAGLFQECDLWRIPGENDINSAEDLLRDPAGYQKTDCKLLNNFIYLIRFTKNILQPVGFMKVFKEPKVTHEVPGK